MKKRIASLLLIALLLVAMLPVTAQAAANEITVYNWGQYISDGTDDCPRCHRGLRGRDRHQGQLPDL